MSARRSICEVARRELVERSRSRVTRVSLALLLILSVGGAIAAARLTGGTPTDHVGIVGARSVALEPAIRLEARAAGRRVSLHELANRAAAVQAVRDGTIDVAVLDGQRLLVKRSSSSAAARDVRAAVAAQTARERLRSFGLTDAQALTALTPPALPVDVLEPTAKSVERTRGLLYVGMIVLYIALVGFGNAVAQGVTEEKSSRVVELLLTTVSPRRLLAGKVTGIGLLGLAQLLLAGTAALIAGRLAGGAGLPSGAPGAVALVLLWFALGYIFYSVAFAGVGALVSRQEDLASASAPVTVVLVASWIVAMVALQDPNGTLARIAAFVPPLAPMVVPARVVLGDMGALGLIAAIAVDVVATIAMILLAARIYERAILQIGAPVTLRRLRTPRAREAVSWR
ncbi:MAG TPA: ABC transporter permease [Solirubrobacteraceae bacterium]|nr:ABC transporter permease [Solirubrobacteraceae bacterium]